MAVSLLSRRPYQRIELRGTRKWFWAYEVPLSLLFVLKLLTLSHGFAPLLVNYIKYQLSINPPSVMNFLMKIAFYDSTAKKLLEKSLACLASFVGKLRDSFFLITKVSDCRLF